ncbi:hypothetical protein NYP20_13750 [Pseudomonas sp. N3-W]|uniref:hypothetical protein n=1 Tax=Pseudomonas sp. N3-W TaxID=2975049 RepID=UPI00217D3C49|nr:hypothetical protein [Pseudomonas sp. N3-W]UWF51964.1 hypothetical protein NYP20_13750 [Pseudomonas sp. N3-W]
MTAIQICALIGLVLGSALIYWTGYRLGLTDGRSEGIEEGKAIQQADQSEQAREHQLLIAQHLSEKKKLYARYEQALAASKLGKNHHQTLLDIAEKLRIAAETFSAFRTGKKLECDSLALRAQALDMAALLGPTAQGDAA